MSANNRYGPQNTIAPYLSEEFQLPVEDKDFKEFYVERERITSSTLNIREIGQYQLQELLTAQTWYSTYQQPVGNTKSNPNVQRYVFRKVINSGGLPNNSIQTIAHGITFMPNGTPPLVTGFFTNIYATASNVNAPGPNPKMFIMIPFVSSPSNGSISIWADTTNVYIQTYQAWPGYNTNIVLEYIKA